MASPLVQWGLLWIFLFQGAPKSKEALFNEAMEWTTQKKYDKAVPLLQTLLTRFQQEQKAHKPSSVKWQQMQLGQCGALFQLADIRWKQGQKSTSCKYHQRLSKAQKQITAQWKKRIARTSLAKQFSLSDSTLQTKCKRLPSYLQFQLVPKHAKVFIQSGKDWKQIQKQPFALTQRKATLKIEAPGYLPIVKKDIPISKWQKHELSFTLKAKPKPKPRIRIIEKPFVRRPKPILRRPKPKRKNQPKKLAKPFYKKWWFWTATGVLVAGGTATAILLINNSAQKPVGFNDNEPEKPYSVW